MLKVIQQTSRTCLAFKILAAGRLCQRQETVERAFKETLSQIEARDAVIVGMYPEFEDQVRLNADYVRRFSGLSKDLREAGTPWGSWQRTPLAPSGYRQSTSFGDQHLPWPACPSNDLRSRRPVRIPGQTGLVLAGIGERECWKACSSIQAQ